MTPQEMKELKNHVTKEVRTAAIFVLIGVGGCTIVLIWLLKAVLP